MKRNLYTGGHLRFILSFFLGDFDNGVTVI